jgi:hypothetical protein
LKAGSGSYASFSNDPKAGGGGIGDHGEEEVDSVLEESFRDAQDDILITDFLRQVSCTGSVYWFLQEML